MHITREEHLLLAKFRCQTTGQISMSVMDPLRKRQMEFLYVKGISHPSIACKLTCVSFL